MYPHERSLVKRMADQPFVLIGMNSDKKERVLAARVREHITWRSFWDGGSTGGPIARAWGVHSWPTIYVIDDTGVIRYKNVRGAAMDEVVETLIPELIDRLGQLVQSDDVQERSLAAFRMGKYRAPKADETLKKLLTDPTSVVQRRAAVGLGLLGKPPTATIELIRQAIEDETATIRADALGVLANVKDPETLALATRSLQDAEVEVRRAAVSALSTVDSPEALTALAGAAADSDLETGRTAVLALGKNKSAKSLELLKGLAAQPAHVQRVTIAMALHEQEQPGTSDRFAKLLKDQDPAIRRQTVTALAELKEFDPIDLYIQAMADADELVSQTASTRLSGSSDARAKAAIQKHFQKQLDELLPDLAAADFRKQYEARKKLAALGPAVAPLLLERMEDASDRTAFALASVIGRARNPALIPPVVKKLKSSDLKKGARKAYERILAYMGEESSKVAIELMAEKAPEARESGARLMVMGNAPTNTKALKAALKDTSPTVRVYAAAGLSRTQDTDALNVLKQAIQDTDSERRRVAINSLAYFDQETALPLLMGLVPKADQSLAMPLIGALGRFKTPKTTEAIVTLMDKFPNVQQLAVYSLMRQDTPEAAKAIGRLVKSKNASVQRTARSALQRMHSPEAKRILQQKEKNK